MYQVAVELQLMLSMYDVVGSAFRYSLFFCRQKTAYEMRISDWSSDVCSSDLLAVDEHQLPGDAFGVCSFGAGRGQDRADEVRVPEIGRASSRERVCQYV